MRILWWTKQTRMLTHGGSDRLCQHIFCNELLDDVLVVGLETVKSMYASKWSDSPLFQKFQAVCSAFEISYEELL